MAQPTSDDIKAYGDLLVKQGKNPNDVKAYTDHLHQLYDVQPQALPAQGGFLDQHPNLKSAVQGTVDAMPAAGAIAGGIAGATAGSIVPGAGTVAGEVGGAMGGAALGSTFKTALNSWIFGKNSSLSAGLTDAATEAAGAGVFQGLPETAIGKAVSSAAGKVASKAGEFLTGIPSQVIRQYAKAADVIKGMSKEADGDIAQASDTVKQGFLDSIKEFRQQMNQQIGDTLKGNTSRVDGSTIVDTLKAAKDKLDADLPETPGIKKSIDELIQTTRNKFDENGQIFASDAHGLKQYFQEVADKAYEGNGTALENAAKKAGAVTRGLVNEAVPEVADANNKLATMYDIQNKIMPSILKPGASESGLIAAGKATAKDTSAGNARNALALKKLSDITGQDFLTPAQNLAAMQALGSSSLKKAGAGAAIGGTIGGVAGYETGGVHGAEVGAVGGAAIGSAVTSPYVLKNAIDMSNSVMGAASSIPGKQTLGTAVLNGSGAMNAIKNNAQPGQGQ